MNIEQKENEKWKEYVERLIYELKAWRIEVPPFDIEEAKHSRRDTQEFNRRSTDTAETTI